MQYDFGDGPKVEGRATVLFVAWLAWSRFRVVIALRDRTQPSVIAALDRTFRLLSGAPTLVLNDNEKTVTTEHVAGVPVRNRETVSFGRHYGVAVLTCQPADPASKGGVEASVKVAKADLVRTDTNLRDQYGSFAEGDKTLTRPGPTRRGHVTPIPHAPPASEAEPLFKVAISRQAGTRLRSTFPTNDRVRAARLAGSARRQSSLGRRSP